MLMQCVLDDKEKIKQGLEEPYYIVTNAIEDTQAEKIREELLRTDVFDIQDESKMVEKGMNASETFKYSRKSIPMADESGRRAVPEYLSRLYQYLNSEPILTWMSEVSGRKCDYFKGAGTIFRPGDRISSHNDVYFEKRPDGKIESRALTFNYWVTKDWQPEYGGRLVWERPFAEIVPTFNTLIMFLPRQVSDHYVEQVADSVTVPRLAVSGWFMTVRDKQPNKLKLNLR